MYLLVLVDDVIAYSKPENFDWKAAPWWVQKEEAAKRKCQSSCTLNSRGVNTRINLCDDKEVNGGPEIKVLVGSLNFLMSAKQHLF